MIAAVTDRNAGGEVGHAGVVLRLVGHDHDLLHAFRRELARDHRDGQRALDRLPAGHGHGVVVEDLVGDRNLGRDRLPDREQPGVLVRAIAEVSKDVGGFGERGLADPWHALATHLAERLRGRGREPKGHIVAADPRQGATALRQIHRRGVVGAARTIVRDASDIGPRSCQRLFLRVQEGDPLLDALTRVEAGKSARDPDLVGAGPGGDAGTGCAGRRRRSAGRWPRPRRRWGCRPGPPRCRGRPG